MIARLILRRALLGLVTVWTMSILVFFGIEILPGDVADAMLGQFATPETLQAIRDELGLERPAYVRYLEWLWGFISGDLGYALATGRHIFDLIAAHAPMTLLLGGITATIAVPLAISLGLFAAMYPGSAFDRIVTTATLMVMSAPEFLVATLLVIIFAVELRWARKVAAGLRNGVSITHRPTPKCTDRCTYYSYFPTTSSDARKDSSTGVLSAT